MVGRRRRGLSNLLPGRLPSPRGRIRRRTWQHLELRRGKGRKLRRQVQRGGVWSRGRLHGLGGRRRLGLFYRGRRRRRSGGWRKCRWGGRWPQVSQDQIRNAQILRSLQLRRGGRILNRQAGIVRMRGIGDDRNTRIETRVAQPRRPSFLRSPSRGAARTGWVQRRKVGRQLQRPKLIDDQRSMSCCRRRPREPVEQPRKWHTVQEESDGEVNQKRGQESRRRTAIPGPGGAFTQLERAGRWICFPKRRPSLGE
jgi:hypothetical protein